MFTFMLLCLYQIVLKMNKLCVKIDLTKVASFSNTQSEVRGLV